MGRPRKNPLPTEVTKAVVNPNDTPEKFRMGEIGYNGIKIFNGISVEETVKELQHPRSIQTYKAMSLHPAISSALTLYNMMGSKANFRFVNPKNPTEEDKTRTKLVESMFEDMEVSLDDVITDILTMNTHGFSIFEKVYRRRTKSAGSMYDDGVIAPRKIAFRNQESIERFIFDETGNTLIGVKQNITGLSDPYGRNSARSDNTVILPRSKFMLFNTGRNRTNPFGTSPLRDVYSHWKMLDYFETLEATGVAKDLQGLPVLTIPAQYMAADASDDQKAMYENFKNIVRNLQQNSQSGLILPSSMDEATRTPLFDLKLLSTEGGKKSFDIDKIKAYYRAMIFIGLNADVLLMGNTTTGSFALGSVKTSLTGAYVESMLKRIVQVFNEDLIKQIYEMNGWDVSRRCKMDYEGVQSSDLETFSKAIQRISAVNFLPRTEEVVNEVLNQLNLDELPENTNLDDVLPPVEAMQTKSGEGMKEGMPSGTGKATGKSGNASDTNSDNTA